MRAAVVCILVTASTVGVALVATGRDAVLPDRPLSMATYPRSPAVQALEVLHAWDRRRASAWATGDVRSLTRLYVVGSRTGARDVRELRRWRERHLRVVGLSTQVSALRLRHRAVARLTLVVTDRTVGGVAVRGRHRVGLPRSAWATHRITLHRVGGTWRVSEVRGQPAR